MRVLWLICFSLVCQLSLSQSQNQLYEIMLKAMYQNTVPQVSVDAVHLPDYSHILDTRSTEEYDYSHIEGALLVGYEGFSIDSLEGIAKEDTILLYCSVGYRSERVGEQMKANGYKNVFNLYGGIFEWANLSKTMVNIDSVETDTVHAFDQNWGIWLEKGVKVYE